MKWVVLMLFVSVFFIRCQRDTDPYANNLGIRPNVIAQLDTAGYTYINWIDSVKDLGTLKPKDSIVLFFYFKNAGTTPRVSSAVSVSCGCTAGYYPHSAILARQTGFIKVLFNAKNYLNGYFRKTIGVITNTRNRKQHILVFSGIINAGA